jgi:type VI secretion system protein ImpA
MASPDVFDVAKLLQPVSKEKPAGEDLRGDSSPTSLYYLIKDARNAARNAERQLIPGDDSAAPPDWRPVLDRAKKALAEKTKDLEITAYLIEALVRLNGYPGLRDGFRLARGLVEQFWDGLYPRPDEEGVSTRVAPLTGLNGEEADGTLIVPINKVAITDSNAAGRLSCAHYFQANDLKKITDAKVREKKISQGAMTPELFQQAVSETPPKFYATLADDLKQATEEYAKLCAELDKRCDGQAPPSSNIRKVLESSRDIIKEVAGHKLQEAPAKEVKPESKPDGAPASPEAGPQPGAIRTRDDALNHLLEVAAFFRRTEPQSVVPYALEQVVRWGRLSLPDLLLELVPDEGPRKGLFKQVGITPPAPPPKEPAKK